MAAEGENRLKELIIPKSRVQITGKTLGRGSYGKVSLVEYDGTLCACKQVRSSVLNRADEAERKRLVYDFLRECHIWSTLRHPNIVQFLGFYYPIGDHSNSLPNLVMERMKMNLTLLVKKYSDIPRLVNLSLLYDVSLGLRYLHAHEPAIIHRDLSPNNILVSRSHLEAKITDLGLAKGILMEDTLTKAPGTKDFMPPEAFDDDPIYGPPLDVFSFGGVSCHLLTREWPTPKATKQIDPITKKRYMLSEVERRQKYIDKLADDAELQNLIARCLDDDAEVRPSAKEISEVIKSTMEIYSKNNTRDGIGPVLWLAEIKCEQEATKASQHLPSGAKLPDLFNEPVKMKWREGACSPVESTGRVAVVFNNAIYLGGGVSSKDECLCRVDVYHPDTNKWGTAIQTSHRLFAMTVVKDQLLIAGGTTASGEATDEMFVLVDSGWKHFNTLPLPRWGASAASYQSLVIIVGGKSGKRSQPSSSTDVYDTSNSQWYKCDDIPIPLSFLQSVVIENRIYILNGLNEKEDVSTAVYVASINGHELKWKRIEDTPWPESVGIGLNNKYLLAVGGKGTNSTVCAFNNKSVFSPSASSWDPIGVLPVMKTSPAVVGMGSILIIIGGSDAASKYSNTVHIATFEL